MRAEIDGMLVVRAELCDRLDSLQRAAARISVRDFSQRLGAIRTMAAAYGLIPVVCLCDALDRAVARPAARLPGRPLFRPPARRDRLRAARREPRARPCSPRSRSASAPEALGSPPHRLRRRLPRANGATRPSCSSPCSPPRPGGRSPVLAGLRPRRAGEQPRRRLRRHLDRRDDQHARDDRCWSRSPCSSPAPPA